MAHAWWRDSDYELFERLQRERDAAQAESARLRGLLERMVAAGNAASADSSACFVPGCGAHFMETHLSNCPLVEARAAIKPATGAKP